ncbi:HugZ family pyridoxamine 5'-phosphate oxidase [Microvirga sp. 2TAF3]|uniref:HugZ family pyridoxamine 5'-phosphate oxidase n=1 Tax=Microvirga sp. 2TAF3 TaxID=3233014 RepID=UPI003F9D1AF5
MQKDPTLPVDEDARGLAKNLLRTARAGALATHDDSGGFPFASLVAVATDMDGTPVILTSQLSTHTKLLERDSRCSLLLSSIGKGDPLAHPRLTLLATAQQVERASDENAMIRQRYLAHHPKAALYVDFPDFTFWRLDLESASLNAGFGRAYRMSAADVLTDMMGLDSLRALEAEAIAHMNSDHRDAVALYATRLCGAREGAWTMTGIDPEGVQLTLGDEIVRLTFPRRLSNAEELRPMLVLLAKQARGAAASQEPG